MLTELISSSVLQLHSQLLQLTQVQLLQLHPCKYCIVSQ